MGTTRTGLTREWVLGGRCWRLVALKANQFDSAADGYVGSPTRPGIGTRAGRPRSWRSKFRSSSAANTDLKGKVAARCRAETVAPLLHQALDEGDDVIVD